MTEYVKRYLSAGSPETIMHGEYKGKLVGIQPLLNGYVCGIYRFPGGDCAEGPMVHIRKLKEKKNTG